MKATGQNIDQYNINSLVFTPKFDCVANVYRDLNGKAMLCVSEIAKPVLDVSYFLNQNDDILLHQMIKNYVEDSYRAPFKDNYSGYIEAFCKWWDKTSPDYKLLGLSLACKNYAGTLDFFGTINGEFWVIEFTKKMISPGWGVLLAAYAMLSRGYLEQLTGKTEPIRRGALQIRQDGTYIFKEYKSIEDYEIFNHLLAVKRWKMANKSF